MSEKMTERETREKLSLAYKALRHQLREHSVHMASLTLAFNKASLDDVTMKLSSKSAAFTALSLNIIECTTLIEFIESLKLDSGSGRSTDIRNELERRHAGSVRNLERAAGDISGRIIKVAESCLESRSKGVVVRVGESVRKQVHGEYARFFKDMLIVGFIQQFGVTTRMSARGDL